MTGPAEKPDELTLPLFAETLSVGKRVVAERVQVRRETRTRSIAVDELLEQNGLVVERVPVGRYVDAMPEIREDGDVTVFPVVEEVAVVVRRLLLREEVHVHKVKSSKRHVETITVREQHAVVSRTPVAASADADAAGSTVSDRLLQKGSTLMTDETIVAVYDSIAHADAAIADLRTAQVPESAISRHTNDNGTGLTKPRETGFWATLFGGPSADDTIYDRSLDAGSSVIVVKAAQHDADAVMAILERHNPLDIDERAAGLGDVTGTAAGSGLGIASTAATAPVAAGTRPIGEGGVIELAEETLAVGKRLVNLGGTRIRRYVVERPAEADVTLRSENVRVERRAVDPGKPVTDADFTEKTIEMTATAEEAVVGKTARIVEEVALHKDVQDRTETVRDTVRRQEVAVEQIPGETSVASPTTAPLSTPKV